MWEYLLSLAAFLEAHNGAITAIATVVVAGFTVVLAIATKQSLTLTRQSIDIAKQSIDLTKESIRLTEDSTKLAKESVDLARNEFIATHRPRIRVKHLWLQGRNAGDRLSVKLLVVNTGDSDATIINLRIGFFLALREARLPDGFLEQRNRISRSDKVGSGITMVYENLTDDTVLTDEQVEEMKIGYIRLCCIGDIEYVDGLQGVRKTAFYRVWRYGKFRVESEPDPDYEYQD